MIYEDYLSHITRRYSFIVKLEEAELSQNHLINQFHSNLKPLTNHQQLTLHDFAQPYIDFHIKTIQKNQLQTQLQSIEIEIEKIKEQVKSYGDQIQQWKGKIKQIGSIVSVGCQRQIQAIRKMAQKINGVKVINQYINEYFKNMGCQSSLKEMLAFISDFYSDQILKKFKPLCKNLSSRYHELRQESENQNKVQHINEMIEIFENKLDVAMHQLQSVNKSKMNSLIDKQILTNQIQSLQAIIQERQDDLIDLIKFNVRVILEQYLQEYEGASQEQSQSQENIEKILFEKVQTHINEYIQLGMTINNLKQLIHKDGIQIEHLQENIVSKTRRTMNEVGMTDRNQLIMEDYTTFNKNFSQDLQQPLNKTKRSVKLGVFKVYRKIFITNSQLSARSRKNKENIFEEQPQYERLLSFEKKALILQKKHPHFHEEIQIKRITNVKVIDDSTVYIHFKKGYMHLNFAFGDSKLWAECYETNYGSAIQS